MTTQDLINRLAAQWHDAVMLGNFPLADALVAQARAMAEARKGASNA